MKKRREKTYATKSLSVYQINMNDMTPVEA